MLGWICYQAKHYTLFSHACTRGIATTSSVKDAFPRCRREGNLTPLKLQFTVLLRPQVAPGKVVSLTGISIAETISPLDKTHANNNKTVNKLETNFLINIPSFFKIINKILNFSFLLQDLLVFLSLYYFIL